MREARLELLFLCYGPSKNVFFAATQTKTRATKQNAVARAVVGVVVTAPEEPSLATGDRTGAFVAMVAVVVVLAVGASVGSIRSVGAAEGDTTGADVVGVTTGASVGISTGAVVGVTTGAGVVVVFVTTGTGVVATTGAAVVVLLSATGAGDGWPIGPHGVRGDIEGVSVSDPDP